MPSTNLVVLSSAGSRKTTFLVEEALKSRDKKVLITTFTIDNLNQIRRYIIDRVGLIPPNISVKSWYSFLLRDCVRPYQNFIYSKKRVKTIFMVEGQSARYIPKTEIDRYYFSESDRIYTDKICDFICTCNLKSKGLVINRLEKLYDKIFIDEVQDLAGHDLNFLELLYRSRSEVFVVGDNRQATYFTNHSAKNKNAKGIKIIDLFRKWEKQGLCMVIEKNECFRSNQIICDFADSLYPHMSPTTSKIISNTGHDGIFIIKTKNVKDYIDKYNPKVLRYNKSINTEGFQALNFGMSKGLTFDRVLIFPTSRIKKYLITGNISDIGDVAKFYVAVTRARHSVAIVCDEDLAKKNKVAQLGLFSVS